MNQLTFTPCARRASLLEAVPEAARNASGGAVWLSPAFSSFDQIRPEQRGGEILYLSPKSIDGGLDDPDPNMHGDIVTTNDLNSDRERMFKRFAPRFFEEKTRGKNLRNHPAPRIQCHNHD
jgi:hypothetical protein